MEAANCPPPYPNVPQGWTGTTRQDVLAALDAVLELHRAGASRREVVTALHSLIATVSHHYEADERVASDPDAGIATARVRTHQSLLRYIEHAVSRIEHWDDSQILVNLRFLDYALTAQINGELFEQYPEFS